MSFAAPLLMIFPEKFFYWMSVFATDADCRWCWDWAIDALLASYGPFPFLHALYVIHPVWMDDLALNHGS